MAREELAESEPPRRINGVAGLEAQRAGIRRDVGPALVNHADDAQRCAHALDLQPVGAFPSGDDRTDRIGQFGNGANAVGHGLHAFLGQLQTILEGRGQIRLLRGFHVGFIGGENGAAAGDDRVRHRGERSILLIRRGDRQWPARFLRARAHIRHQGGDVGRSAVGLVNIGCSSCFRKPFV